MDDNNLIIEILVRYSLRQKLSGEELARVEDWRAQSDNHRVLLDQFRNPHWVAEQRKKLHSAPTEAMWADIRGYIEQSGVPAPVLAPVAEPVRVPVWRRIGWQWMGWGAAGVIVLAVAVWLFWPVGKVSKSAETAVVPAAEPVKKMFVTGATAGTAFQLPDQSVVLLNKNSRLQYTEDASNGTRICELEGEAFFDVANGPARPFVVRFRDGSSAQVLGTSFDARAYEGEAGNWVTVLSGAVKVANAVNSAVLKANQQARVDGLGVDVSTVANAAGVLAWQARDSVKRKIELNNADLPAVLRAVAALYRVQISNPQNIRGVRIRAGLSQEETLENTLKSIEFMQGGAVRLVCVADTVVVLPGH